MASISSGDINARNLLDTASYLNDRLLIGQDTATAAKIVAKENDIEYQKTVLQDLRDAIETYNREFIERDNELTQKPKPFLNNPQDYSLFILFAGYLVFTCAVFVFIVLYSKRPMLLSMIFIVLSVLPVSRMIIVLKYFLVDSKDILILFSSFLIIIRTPILFFDIL